MRSTARRLLVLAGAGSGKTEVMARRVAWWTSVEDIAKGSIIAFTFTERAAEEMKFRIRRHIQRVTPEGEDATLGTMYVGTIHGFCLKFLREWWPDRYHNFDVVDESGRIALIQRGYHGILGLSGLATALGRGQYDTIDYFLRAYDLLNEYGLLDVELPSETAPHGLHEEASWCKEAELLTDVGSGPVAEAFSVAAARYYAYMQCRRFLDFSTSQAEAVRRLTSDPDMLTRIRAERTHLVVDEVQDINVVQDLLIRSLVGDTGYLTSVGDHRQAIFAWRGGRVDIMGRLHDELQADPGGDVIPLEANFRSTPRIINLSNEWAHTIGQVASMGSPDMEHGSNRRTDFDNTHVAVLRFDTRDDEGAWIGDTIGGLVRVHAGPQEGATHDAESGVRGISYSDIALLIRSSTDARTYMSALEERGIPAVFKAGPDLFSQPEVLLFLAALGSAAGLDRFFGNPNYPLSLPGRINAVLGCPPEPSGIIPAAGAALRSAGLPFDPDDEVRLLKAAELIADRLSGETPAAADVKNVRTSDLRTWLAAAGRIRRVFPQRVFHWLLAEANVGKWDAAPSRRCQTAMFHLGALSTLVKGVETPGWTDPNDFKYQVIALYLWGAANARTEEEPLLVPPDAVTITTIHSAKGLEFPVVFMADVCSRRFPSQFARRSNPLPFDGEILESLNPGLLADNSNLDGERRLMYVALTRAERYLFVSSSRPSPFFVEVENLAAQMGATTNADSPNVPANLHYAASQTSEDIRLVTTFSDLRYYLECPRDFYLRKVLGFAPTIDQAFGYGRGVHNVMRAIELHPFLRTPRNCSVMATGKGVLDEKIPSGVPPAGGRVGTAA